MVVRFETITNHVNEVQETIELFLNERTNEIFIYVKMQRLILGKKESHY